MHCRWDSSPYHSRSYSYVHSTNPVYFETPWSDGHNSKSIKLMATNQSHQLHMLWQLQVRCLKIFCRLNIIWLNKWFCLLQPLSLYHYLGSQTLSEAFTTIWGPARFGVPPLHELEEVVFAPFSTGWKHHRWKTGQNSERGALWCS